ncbi:MAG: 50S ribosomal protein L13, partial [Opitutaceae bacterium]|nr:50S ribosomal protein L13 [Opitutaceae bacterium]
MKTILAKKEDVQPKWFVVDASGQVLGRLAVRIANTLRGRNKTTYTPHVDTGDFVIVVNAEKVVLTGKKEEQNSYMFFNGYVGRERHL